MLYYYNIFLLLAQEISCYCCVLNNQSTQEKLFVSSVRWHFFVFRNSVEKFCVSWAFPLIECVAVWALKLPVVSAPLRSLHNRSPPDFLQLIPTYSNPRVAKLFYGITEIQRNRQRTFVTNPSFQTQFFFIL